MTFPEPYDQNAQETPEAKTALDDFDVIDIRNAHLVMATSGEDYEMPGYRKDLLEAILEEKLLTPDDVNSLRVTLQINEHRELARHLYDKEDYERVQFELELARTKSIDALLTRVQERTFADIARIINLPGRHVLTDEQAAQLKKINSADAQRVVALSAEVKAERAEQARIEEREQLQREAKELAARTEREVEARVEAQVRGLSQTPTGETLQAESAPALISTRNKPLADEDRELVTRLSLAIALGQELSEKDTLHLQIILDQSRDGEAKVIQSIINEAAAEDRARANGDAQSAANSKWTFHRMLVAIRDNEVTDEEDLHRRFSELLSNGYEISSDDLRYFKDELVQFHLVPAPEQVPEVPVTSTTITLPESTTPSVEDEDRAREEAASMRELFLQDQAAAEQSAGETVVAEPVAGDPAPAPQLPSDPESAPAPPAVQEEQKPRTLRGRLARRLYGESATPDHETAQQPPSVEESELPAPPAPPAPVAQEGSETIVSPDAVEESEGIDAWVEFQGSHPLGEVSQDLTPEQSSDPNPEAEQSREAQEAQERSTQEAAEQHAAQVAAEQAAEEAAQRRAAAVHAERQRAADEEAERQRAAAEEAAQQRSAAIQAEQERAARNAARPTEPNLPRLRDPRGADTRLAALEASNEDHAKYLRKLERKVALGEKLTDREKVVVTGPVLSPYKDRIFDLYEEARQGSNFEKTVTTLIEAGDAEALDRIDELAENGYELTDDHLNSLYDLSQSATGRRERIVLSSILSHYERVEEGIPPMGDIPDPGDETSPGRELP